MGIGRYFHFLPTLLPYNAVNKRELIIQMYSQFSFSTLKTFISYKTWSYRDGDDGDGSYQLLSAYYGPNPLHSLCQLILTSLGG